jgi:hypothetical protein
MRMEWLTRTDPASNVMEAKCGAGRVGVSGMREGGVAQNVVGVFRYFWMEWLTRTDPASNVMETKCGKGRVGVSGMREGGVAQNVVVVFRCFCRGAGFHTRKHVQVLHRRDFVLPCCPLVVLIEMKSFNSHL